PRRSRLPSSSRLSESAFRLWSVVRSGPSGWPPLVNTNGRGSSPAIARPTTSSEWPKPYWAAVSIQLTPSSSAWWIAAIESSSSCEPQPQSYSAPPIAQAPTPTRVISRPVRPSSAAFTRPPPPARRRRAGSRRTGLRARDRPRAGAPRSCARSRARARPRAPRPRAARGCRPPRAARPCRRGRGRSRLRPPRCRGRVEQPLGPVEPPAGDAGDRGRLVFRELRRAGPDLLAHRPLREAPKRDRLAARADRLGQRADLVGHQHDHRVGRRLLEVLQQRVGGLVVQEMRPEKQVDPPVGLERPHVQVTPHL